MAGNLLTFGGFWLLASAWEVLYRAQRTHQPATSGAYARIRHPQYVALVAIMFGVLLQWPTILTVAMFPVLLMMYARLAIHEEAAMRREFGPAHDEYAARTPRFVPAIGDSSRRHDRRDRQSRA